MRYRQGNVSRHPRFRISMAGRQRRFQLSADVIVILAAGFAQAEKPHGWLACEASVNVCLRMLFTHACQAKIAFEPSFCIDKTMVIAFERVCYFMRNGHADRGFPTAHRIRLLEEYR